MNTSQSQSEKGVHSSPPSDTVIEDHHSNHSPPISSHIVYYCSKCHGTVEGPKYSTCTCAVPSLQTEPPSSSSTHSLHHNFWKGISDTKNIFNAAVNMFQKRKSGNFDQSHSHEAVPLHTETSSSSVEKIKSPSKVDSDDEYEESATTLTTTVASVFPNVSDTKEEPLILNENTSNTEEYPANPQLEDSSSTS